MRILLASSASYVPPRGGSTRSNLVWLETLMGAGHQCRVVCGMAAQSTTRQRELVARETEEQRIGLRILESESGHGLMAVDREGLRVDSAEDPARVPVLLAERIRTFDPDWVLVSSEDLGQILLREAVERTPGRAVYLAHTPQMFPFGPASLNPNAAGVEAVKHCAAVIAIGGMTARYIEEHGGVKPVVIHPPMYGEGPFPDYGAHWSDEDSGGAVMLINPCAVKGLPIFLGLARQFPETRFAALPGWGTTPEVREQLAEYPNIEIWKKVRHIDEALARTRVLLAPSLWPEGFGLVVTEAMLRGIPVMASNQGGLVEAKLRTKYVLAVRPIVEYLASFDENRMPLPVVPEQDLNPWADALRELLTDREVYRDAARHARRASHEFVEALDARRLEQFLLELKPGVVATVERRSAAASSAPQGQAGSAQDLLSRLSPERRALLLQKLKKDRG
jgi:glycosyltransferase involved in cell wall biosynthesis